MFEIACDKLCFHMPTGQGFAGALSTDNEIRVGDELTTSDFVRRFRSRHQLSYLILSLTIGLAIADA